jgi:hypothetical protein
MHGRIASPKHYSVSLQFICLFICLLSDNSLTHSGTYCLLNDVVTGSNSITHMSRRLVNNELEVIWKVVVVSKF